MSSPKREIADSIKELINFDNIEINYNDNYDYVRKVCALIASKLCSTKSGYKEADYNKLPNSNCKMCNYSKFKAISDILLFAQKQCGKGENNTYNVSMFLVDENYITLPFLLEHIDE